MRSITFVPDFFLQILLLDRGQRGIDDEQARALLLGQFGDLLDLALAEQRRGPNGAHTECLCRDDVDADRLRKACGLLHPRFGRPPRGLARKFGDRDDRTLATRDVDFAVAVVLVQDSSSSPPGA